MQNRLKFTILILIAFLVIPTIIKAPVEGSETSTAIAESAIETAFKNVLSAQNAGGNVTLLIDRLTLACALLDNTENAQRSNDSIDVTAKIINAQQIAEQVNEDAIQLLDESASNYSTTFWATIIFSIIFSFFFVLILFFVWRRFKQHYTRKLLGMKPEVVENAP
jgi:hypothetical protein